MVVIFISLGNTRGGFKGKIPDTEFEVRLGQQSTINNWQKAWY